VSSNNHPADVVVTVIFANARGDAMNLEARLTLLDKSL